MPHWLTTIEHRTLAAALDRVVPGSGAAGGADYIDQLLAAFTFDPPRIWAGGPTGWLELGRIEELAWRTRIEGSKGLPEREFNGPVVGWQQQYREGLQRPDELDDAFRELVSLTHACEALYGDPIYGGNRDRRGWEAIAFDGDVQPRGWTDDEVSSP